MSTQRFGDGLVWRKSGRSGGEANACVFTVVTSSVAGLRDSKLGETSPRLWIDRRDWPAFLDGVRSATTLHD